MDEGCSRAVREAFVKLYDEGLIYRGSYITNWCPSCQTVISDDEVEHEDHDSHIWHLRYPLADGSGYIEVATTRPETMLGDTAVAVHPSDERYQSLLGKDCLLYTSKKADVGVFGGSGFYSFLSDVEEVHIETPYGSPSDSFKLARLGDKTVAFLPRHGSKHTVPPHKINYRANLWACLLYTSSSANGRYFA